MEKPIVTGTIPDVELPLPLYAEENLGNMELPDGTMLTLVLGLASASVTKLKERSLDPDDEELQANTSDRTRFGEGSYEDWYAHGRTPVALLDRDRNLAALLWFGAKPLPEDIESGTDRSLWDTVAFRSYAPYRGKGLMTPFSRFGIDTYKQLSPGRSLWLATNTDNQAGIRLYEKLGFRKAGTDGNGRVVMLME